MTGRSLLGGAVFLAIGYLLGQSVLPPAADPAAQQPEPVAEATLEDFGVEER